MKITTEAEDFGQLITVNRKRSYSIRENCPKTARMKSVLKALKFWCSSGDVSWSVHALGNPTWTPPGKTQPQCASCKTPTYKKFRTTIPHPTHRVATQINSHILCYVNSPNCTNATSKLNEKGTPNKISRLPVSRGGSLAGRGSSKLTGGLFAMENIVKKS